MNLPGYIVIEISHEEYISVEIRFKGGCQTKWWCHDYSHIYQVTTGIFSYPWVPFWTSHGFWEFMFII